MMYPCRRFRLYVAVKIINQMAVAYHIPGPPSHLFLFLGTTGFEGSFSAIDSILRSQSCVPAGCAQPKCPDAS